jgi:RNA polymerase sigma-70 factor (ECF subfamily)
MEPAALCDDAQLLARIAQRDRTAFSRLYDRYARVIHAIAFRSLRSAEDSEEIVLDVFAQVWRIAEQYDPAKGKADAWLFMLARSRILDRVRKLQRGKLSESVLTDLAQIQTPSASVDPVEQATIAERRDRVLAALKTLPEEQRLAIELAYYRSLTHHQIAEQTGVALGTIKTRIRLGLSKLRSALDRGG